jgi:hypothetical protein
VATSPGFRPIPSSYLLSFDVDQRKPVAIVRRFSPRLSLIARSSAARRRRRTDLGAEEHNRELVRRLEAVQLAISRDELPMALRLFRGQQRAIGEVMMTPTGLPESARYETLGVARFFDQLDDPAFEKWFHRIRFGLDHVASADQIQSAALGNIQHSLVDLIEFLDPSQLRLPARLRDRVTPPAMIAPSGTVV